MNTTATRILGAAVRICTAFALATMTLTASLSSASVPSANAALATIKTINSDRTMNTANRLKLTKDNCTVVSTDSNIKLKDINGMTAILAKIKSTTGAFSYNNPYELLFENATAIGGRKVNVRLKCTKVAIEAPYGANPFSSRDDPSYDNNYLMIAAIRRSCSATSCCTPDLPRNFSRISFPLTVACRRRSVVSPNDLFVLAYCRVPTRISVNSNN